MLILKTNILVVDRLKHLSKLDKLVLRQHFPEI